MNILEIVVDPRTGKWYTVGDNGAQFVDIPKGAIVFNHIQSQSLLENGYVSGRAHALASGTAMVTGGIGVTNVGYSSKRKSIIEQQIKNATAEDIANAISDIGSDGSSDDNDSQDSFKYIDRIEILIDRIHRKIDAIKDSISDVFSLWSDRGNSVTKQIRNITYEISVQERAARRYLEEAHNQIAKYNLKPDWIEDIENGGIAFSYLINNDEKYEGYQEYQKWYEKYLDARDSIQQLNNDRTQLYKDQFDYIKKDFENQINLNESLADSNEKTYTQSTTYFEDMRSINQKNLTLLTQEAQKLQAQLNKALNEGNIEKGSEAWQEMQKDINNVKKEIASTNIEIIKLYEEQFSYIQNSYKNQLSTFEHNSNIYQKQASLIEIQGYRASEKLLSQQQAVQRKSTDVLQKELISLENEFAKAMETGKIEEYSDAWYSMQSSINSTKESIYDSRIETEKLAKAMRDLSWEKFDFKQETKEYLNEESDFLINMMSFTDLYDKKGKPTDTGLATLALHNVKADTYEKKSRKYLIELGGIEMKLAADPENVDYLQRRQELLKLSRETAIALENEQSAIVSFVKNGIKLELDSLKELIDTYKEALDSEKDLYDYQNNIADKSKKIADIQKQLTAYTNDSSEETRAVVQKLQVDLSEAQKDLKDTEYTRSIADQKKLLDDIYTEYESFLNTRLDDTNKILEDVRMVTNAIPNRIGEVLKITADSANLHLSTELNSIWDNAYQILSEWNASVGEQQQITRETLSAANDSWGTFGESLRGSVLDKYAEVDGNVNQVKTAVDMNAHGIENVFNDLENQKGQIVANIDKDAEDIENVIYQKDNTEIVRGGFTTTNDALEKITKQVEAISERIGSNSKGDIDGDSVITSADALMILRASVGLEQLNETQLRNADVDGDGQITSSDALEILRNSVGLSGKVKSYSTGGLADYTGIANIHGTKDKPELVLNANDTQNFMSLRDTLRNIAAKQDLSIIGSGYNVAPSTFAGLAKVSTFASGMSSPNVTQNTTVNLGGIAIDHVEDYNDLISQMQKDKNFEKLIRAMTIDQMTGKGSLTKYEHRW